MSVVLVISLTEGCHARSRRQRAFDWLGRDPDLCNRTCLFPTVAGCHFQRGWNAADILAIALASLQSAKAEALAGFVDSGGTFISLGYPGSTGSVPTGTNNTGNIVGQAFGINAYSNGFYLSGGTFSPLHIPGGIDAGTSVGTSQPIALAAPTPAV